MEQLALAEALPTQIEDPDGDLIPLDTILEDFKNAVRDPAGNAVPIAEIIQDLRDLRDPSEGLAGKCNVVKVEEISYELLQHTTGETTLRKRAEAVRRVRRKARERAMLSRNSSSKSAASKSAGKDLSGKNIGGIPPDLAAKLQAPTLIAAPDGSLTPLELLLEDISEKFQDPAGKSIKCAFT